MVKLSELFKCFIDPQLFSKLSNSNVLGNYRQDCVWVSCWFSLCSQTAMSWTTTGKIVFGLVVGSP